MPTQRSVVALDDGLDEAEAVACARPTTTTPTHERARRCATRGCSATENDQAAFDAVYAELRDVFSDEEVVELGCFAAIAIGGVTLSRSLRIDP